MLEKLEKKFMYSNYVYILVVFQMIEIAINTRYITVRKWNCWSIKWTDTMEDLTVNDIL